MNVLTLPGVTDNSYWCDISIYTLRLWERSLSRVSCMINKDSQKALSSSVASIPLIIFSNTDKSMSYTCNLKHGKNVMNVCGLLWEKERWGEGGDQPITLSMPCVGAGILRNSCYWVFLSPAMLACQVNNCNMLPITILCISIQFCSAHHPHCYIIHVHVYLIWFQWNHFT